MTRRTVVYPISIFLMVFLALVFASGCGCGNKESSGPKISSVTPNSGAPGTEVKITGENFGSSQGTSVVHVGDESSGVISWSSEQIIIQAIVYSSEMPERTANLTSDGMSCKSSFRIMLAR